MALKVSRRHRTECEGGHPEDPFSGEFNRKHAGKSTWEDAKAVAAAWETANSWGGKPVMCDNENHGWCEGPLVTVLC